MTEPDQTAHAVEREHVTAIVVSHGRDAAYLPDVVRAVLAQDHAPNTLVLISAHSSDPHTTRAALEAEGNNIDFALINVGEQDNLGLSISTGLARAAEQGVEVSSDGWLWILHGDSAPAPQALDRLLRNGEQSPRTGVVGTKQLAWDSEEQPILLEVGINATRLGRRVPEVEPDERDQGQLDSRSDVLAVGTAGMLVRSTVWKELGGLNPDLGPFGDGLEFCRRVRHAGLRVVVEPAAVVYHAQQSLREDTATSFGQRRRAQNLNALLAVPGWAVALLWVGLVLVAPVRALWRLLTKDPVRARGELAAGWATLTSIDAIRRGRKQMSAAGTYSQAMTELEASNREVRAAKKESRRSRTEAELLARRPDQVTLNAQADLRRHTRRGALLALVGGSALALLLHFNSLANGVFDGGTLTQDTATGTELWGRLTTGWLPAGDGVPYPLEPMWASLIPILLIGQPLGLTLGGLVSALLVLSAPLAAGSAYLASGQFTKSWSLRLVAALVWVAAPPFLESNTYGWFPITIIFVVLPVALFAVVRAWRGSPHHIGLAALACAILAAAAPIFVLAAVAVSLIGVLARRGARLRWLWIGLPALAVQATNMLSIKRMNLEGQVQDFFLSVPGAPVSSTDWANIGSRDIADLLTTINISRQPDATWFFLVPLLTFAVAAAVSLVRHRRRPWILVGWLMAALGMMLASLATRTPAGLINQGTDVVVTHHVPALGLTIVWTGLTLVLVNGAFALRTDLRSKSFGIAHLVAPVLVYLVPLGAVVIIGSWFGLHRGDNMLEVAGTPEPALARTLAEGPERARVLALTASPDGVAGELWRGSGIELSEYSTVRSMSHVSTDPATLDLSQAIADLTISSDTVSASLADHAVGVVLVRPSSEGSYDRELSAQLGSVPGLEFVATSEVGTFWRVSDVAARVQVRGQVAEVLDSQVITASGDLGPSADERTLYLAERADARWVAKFNGQMLERTEHDWANAWIIPAGESGEITIDFDDPTYVSILVGALIILAVSVIVAVPVRLPRGRVE